MGGKEVSGPLSKICCEKKSHTRFEIYSSTVYANECVERTSGFIQDPGSLNFHRLCFDTGNHFGSYETKPPLFCIPFLRLLQAGASVLPLSGGKTRSRARRFWNHFSCKGHSAGHRATLQHSKGHTRKPLLVVCGSFPVLGWPEVGLRPPLGQARSVGVRAH